MSFDAQKTRLRALEQWFVSPQGIDIANFFAAELVQLREVLYGDALLQLGSYGKNPWLQNLHYSHKWCASPYVNSSSTLITSLTKIPIDRNSVDCLIAPLIMEIFNHQKNPIDEIDRVLKPMGYVVFLGINPLSLWGIYTRLKRVSIFGSLAGKPMSVLAVKRAMIHRGYALGNLSSFYYIPPVKTQKWLAHLKILNELGKMISPCPAGFYCLVMQKHQEIHPDLLHSKQELWEKKRGLLPACQLNMWI